MTRWTSLCLYNLLSRIFLRSSQLSLELAGKFRHGGLGGPRQGLSLVVSALAIASLSTRRLGDAQPWHLPQLGHARLVTGIIPRLLGVSSRGGQGDGWRGGGEEGIFVLRKLP